MGADRSQGNEEIDTIVPPLLALPHDGYLLRVLEQRLQVYDSVEP